MITMYKQAYGTLYQFMFNTISDTEVLIDIVQTNDESTSSKSELLTVNQADNFMERLTKRGYKQI